MFAIERIGVNEGIAKKMNHSRLARRITAFRLKRQYSKRTKELLNHFGTGVFLDRMVVKKIPVHINQAYVSFVLKHCIKKLKKNIAKHEKK